MTTIVPGIAEVLMNKIALWISNRGNYWTAKSVMIASNGTSEILDWNGDITNFWPIESQWEDFFCDFSLEKSANISEISASILKISI